MASGKMSEDVEQTKKRAQDEARRAGETIADEAKSVAAQAKDLGHAQAEQRFEQGKDELGHQVQGIHSAIDGAAERLREENSPLAGYADELSSQLAKFSKTIESSSLDDLAVKTRQVARENPGLFMLGSVVAGLAAARFFKASADHHQDDDDRDDYDRDRYDASGYGASSRYGSAGAVGERASGYRSPTAGDDMPYRDGSTSMTGDSTTGTTTPASRVPMDSALATGTMQDTAPVSDGVADAGTSTTTPLTPGAGDEKTGAK